MLTLPSARLTQECAAPQASFFDLVARDCTAECTALLPANSTIRARLAAPAPPEARPESVLQLPTTLPAQPERPSDAKA